MESPLNEDISPFIEYFKAAVENRPEAPQWSDWLPQHEAELEKRLPRGRFLMLIADNPYREIMLLLKQHGIEYPVLNPHWLHPKFHRPSPIPAKWLTRRTTTKTVRKSFSVPSTLQHSQVEVMIAWAKPGDEWWRFRSPPRTWANMCGRAGYALVRDSMPIDSILTEMN